MKPSSPFFDVIVVGGGHAGAEASLVCVKLGLSVSLVTINPRAVGRMSCNPSIGGLAKGQLVREIDVLGGVMGRVADVSALQYKMLNKSKGRAVWSPRAQVDKIKYSRFIRKAIDDDKNKTISSKEWKSYFDEIMSEADKDKDETISDKEWQAWIQRRQSSSRLDGRGNGPNVGDPAPKVSAQFMNKKGSLEFNNITRLSVIIFGSYT